jgi:hypothetical protein
VVIDQDLDIVRQALACPCYVLSICKVAAQLHLLSLDYRELILRFVPISRFLVLDNLTEMGQLQAQGLGVLRCLAVMDVDLCSQR